MLVDHMLCSIDAARTTELAQLGSDISRAYANGALGEDDYQRLWEAIQERRAETRPKPRTAPPRAPWWPARRRQRSPDKQASIERRRRLAASGPMSPALAAKFTVCQLAVFKVVGEEVIKHGVCMLCIDAIAAMAGTCPTVVRAAFDEAERLLLLTVQERRRLGQRSLTNVVHIISGEWLTWLRKGGGSRKTKTTNNRYSDSLPRKPGLVSDYRHKGLSEGGYRPLAREKGGAKVAATSK
jgi:hypothetical protein